MPLSHLPDEVVQRRAKTFRRWLIPLLLTAMASALFITHFEQDGYWALGFFVFLVLLFPFFILSNYYNKEWDKRRKNNKHKAN